MSLEVIPQLYQKRLLIEGWSDKPFYAPGSMDTGTLFKTIEFMSKDMLGLIIVLIFCIIPVAAIIISFTIKLIIEIFKDNW